MVQRNLGHASAAMTMDLNGHLIDDNLWDAANRVGGLEVRAPRTPRSGSGDILGTREANHISGETSDKD